MVEQNRCIFSEVDDVLRVRGWFELLLVGRSSGDQKPSWPSDCWCFKHPTLGGAGILSQTHGTHVWCPLMV